MKKLFYVRHGQTDMNVAGHFSGQVETELTAEGKRQALETGQKLSNDGLQIDCIVCSPLGRAYETAKIIAAKIDFPVGRIVKSPLFLERAFGPLEGTPAQEYVGDPVKYRELDTIDGTESLEELQLRAVKALKYAEAIPEDNVLIVAHGAFGRAFRRAVNKQPHTDEYNKLLMIGNAEVLELI